MTISCHVDTVDRLAAVFAQRVRHLLDQRRAPSWTLAVPGGSVAERLLPAIAAHAALPWSRCDVCFADERAVPPSDPASNWQTCRSATRDTAMDAARWHRMPGDAADLDAAAAAYADLLRRLTAPDGHLTAVLLGVGEDGHVASIFPGAASAAQEDAPVFVERHAPKPPPVRLSLGPAVLASAGVTCVAALGAGKRAIAREAMDPASPTPVARLLRSSRSPLLLLDREAASSKPPKG